METGISVITATYNAGESIERLIVSLKSQSDGDFEWIVVDGASTDNTVKLVSGAGDFLAKCISEKDFGIYDALNKGIAAATGEYYLVVGADDMLNVDAIANFRAAITDTGADLIAASVVAGGKVHSPGRGPSWLYGQFAYVAAHAVGTAFKRSLHERFGYYTRRFPIAADALFIKRACKGGATVCKADFVAGVFGCGGVSSIDVAGRLSESFRVQLETERKFLQVFLHVLRLIKNFRKL